LPLYPEFFESKNEKNDAENRAGQQKSVCQRIEHCFLEVEWLSGGLIESTALMRKKNLTCAKHTNELLSKHHAILDSINPIV